MYKKITYSQKKHNSASCKLTQIHGVPCVKGSRYTHTQNRSCPIRAFCCRDPKEKKKSIFLKYCKTGKASWNSLSQPSPVSLFCYPGGHCLPLWTEYTVCRGVNSQMVVRWRPLVLEREGKGWVFFVSNSPPSARKHKKQQEGNGML